MCGEQAAPLPAASAGCGSPPRVRGTGCKRRVKLRLIGITPACAGNRCKHSKRPMGWQDHPRVCGEQGYITSWSEGAMGSPPRVRGTAQGRRRRNRPVRITPACAGNSIFLRRQSEPPQDHPRVCGEQTKKSPSFLHSFLSDQENSFSLKYNCSISSQSFCARWTSLQGSSKCFAKVDS